MASSGNEAQVDLVPVEREEAALGLRDEEQVADEVDQPVRAPLDDGEIGKLVGVRLLCRPP